MVGVDPAKVESNQSKDRASYRLVIRAPIDPSDPEGIRRLRRLLKGIVRGYGFAVVGCEPTPAPIPAPPPELTTPAPAPRGGYGVLPRGRAGVATAASGRFFIQTW